MTVPLLTHLVLSLLIGGLFVAMCSVVAERLGTEIGGLVAGLPSTVVITLLFVGLTESPARAVEETAFVPVALALNCALLSVFGLAAARGPVAALLTSVSTWVVLAAAAVHFIPRKLDAGLALLAVAFAAGMLLTRRTVAGAAPAGGHCTLPQLVGRGLFGGTIVATGVWLSAAGGPSVGGVASAFPASCVSTLALMSWSRGTAFASGLLRPMMVSGSMTMLLYALVVRATYSSLGVWTGTALALLASTTGGGVLYLVRRHRPRPSP